MRISVVIPCWRDEESLATLLEGLAGEPDVEWIPAVAEARPAFLEKLGRLGARPVACPRPDRGTQMNLGAARAGGEALLFHHVDSALAPAHLRAVRAALAANPEAVGDYRAFDERHPGLRWAERVERWHCRAFGTLYGDQSVFVRAAVFRRIGGFAEIPLMEDVEFSRRLRRAGPVALLDPAMASSPRKHLREGPWRTTLRNALLLGLFQAGVPADRLHRWYYGSRLPTRGAGPGSP